ncbi:MAG TPA: hypothetical protein VE262_22415 [Blastocatellia bacterium]|nr:hypothetical protein [Blastocatellia bacterium]
MDIQTHNIKLIGEAGKQIDGTFTLDPDQGTCRLTLRYSDKELIAEEDDYFDALCSIRRRLETVGMRPLCYGASKNVFPSGMSRDMGQGLIAYRMSVGQPARMVDMVSIFETGPDVEPASVEEQEQYFEQWLKSLRR